MKSLFFALLFCGVFLATPSDSSLKKLHVIGKKIIGSRIAGLVKKDEPDDCHVYYEDQTTPHCSTTYEQVGYIIIL